MSKPEKVWYACFGSNLLESRFHCYIAGGQPVGSTRFYAGCRDKSLPEEHGPVELPYELYFAKSAQGGWHGGGVAFIKPEKDSANATYGKQYLITRNQFIDLVKQEIGHEGPLHLDFERAENEGHLLFKEDAWYNQLLFVGYDRGYPIFTFTNTTFLRQEINRPHPTYLTTIMKGLEAEYDLTESELVDYLIDKEGINRNILYKTLKSDFRASF